MTKAHTITKIRAKMKTSNIKSLIKILIKIALVYKQYYNNIAHKCFAI